MTEVASPRQRVWFRIRSDVDRNEAIDLAAGVLLREKPEGTAILSLELYPPGEGAEADDPRVETFMWELQYVVDESTGRDWDWGSEVNAALADRVRERLEQR